MNLVEQYRNQNIWRNWQTYIDKLPIHDQDTVFDMGCGIGCMTKLLAEKSSQVYGIDKNIELIKEAQKNNSASNIIYLHKDIFDLNHHQLPPADGIWTSFVVAYFPNLEPLLNNWIKMLKSNGWMAIVEMSGLFSHEPLSMQTKNTFNSYAHYQRTKNTYDFNMGEKLERYIINAGLTIQHYEVIFDDELTFNGPADLKILNSWKGRFDRMIEFKEYLGEQEFDSVKNEFLDCLTNPNHISNSTVSFIIASK